VRPRPSSFRSVLDRGGERQRGPRKPVTVPYAPACGRLRPLIEIHGTRGGVAKNGQPQSARTHAL
jgi:hypothetical protein